MEVYCIVKHFITCLRRYYELNKLEKRSALPCISKASHAFLNNGFCSIPTKAHANVPTRIYTKIMLLNICQTHALIDDTLH